MIKKITLSIFIIALCGISYKSISYASGPPTGMTNGPGESNCTQSGCHSGSIITSGNDWNTISLTSNFTGSGYIPDSTYTIKIAHTQSGINKWGFEATVLDGSNTKAGTLSASGRVQKLTASSRDYVEHTSSGTSSTSTNATDWTFTWKAPSTNVGTVKFYACVMASNNNGSESGDQVFGKSFSITPSSLLPVAKASSAEATTCAGNTITINGSSTQNATSWSWVFTGSGVSPTTSTSQNPQVKYNNVGTNFLAILTTKNAKGTSKADTLKIIVNSKPSISTTPNAGTYRICKGDSILLKANGSSSFSYTWNNGLLTQNIYAKDTGVYSVTAKSSNGCSSTLGNIKILHHTVQSMGLTRDVTNDTICYERPIKVTASGTTTFDSILYYNSAGLFQRTAINPQTFKFSSSTDLFAKGKDSKGCLTAFTKKLNFVVKKGISAPQASCTNKTTASFEISWADVTNAKGYKISLDSGKSWITPSSGNMGLSHRVLGFPTNTDIEVQLKALDIFPCFESEITKAVCGSIPCSPLSYDLEWEKEVCKMDAIHFKIKNLKADNYSFTIDNGKTFKDTTFTVTADFSRTYKFELTDSNNLSCPVIKRDAAVKVWEIPSLILSSNNAQNIFCEGSSAQFEVVSKGMQEYNFFLNNKSKQKSSANSWNLPNPLNLDSVWVTVTNGACVSTSGKIKLGVKPLPTAKFSYTFNNRKATFIAAETGTAKFYWDFGDGTFDSIASKTVKNYNDSTAFNGFVKLKVVDEFGCIQIDSMEIEIPAGIKNALIDYGIQIYPQPSNHKMNVIIPVSLINANLSIVDVTGRNLYKVVLKNIETEISTIDFPNGIYLISVVKGNMVINGKIIVSH